MAVLEVQFKQDVFFKIIAAQVLRINPPGELLSKLPPGALIERIEVGQVAFAGPNEIVLDDTEIGLRVPLTVKVTTLANARNAGSLQPPATIDALCTVWLRLQGVVPYEAPPGALHPAGLRWFIQRVDVDGARVPIFPVARDLPFDPGVPVDDVRLAAVDGMISIRFVTPSGGGSAPLTNRLGGDDWGQFIDGPLFAETLAQEVAQAAYDAAAGSSDPVIEVTSPPTGHWEGMPPTAHTSVELTALDALPADVDVPIALYASSFVQIDPVLHQIVLLTRISWFAHDFVTTYSGAMITAVEDKVSATVLKKLKPRPGQKEVERGDNHIVYKSIRPFIEPITNLFKGSVQHFTANENGATATGRVDVYPPPIAFFTLEDQHWEGGVNCTKRAWAVDFKPAIVHILGPDRYYSLEFRQTPTADPSGVLIPHVSWSGQLFAGNQIAHVSYDPMILRDPPVGAKVSGFIVTNLGVRWVDLGRVPSSPPAPADPVGIQAFVISTCMAISDPWGVGIMNLEWIPDPPELDLGLAKLREWTLVGADIQDARQIELVATGPRGERPLTTLMVNRGSVFAQVITEADETLQLRTDGSLSSAPPQILQRWIVPMARVPVGAQVQELDFSGGHLFALGRDEVRAINVAPPKISAGGVFVRDGDVAIPARLLQRATTRGNPAAAVPRTAARGRAVAVLHKGSAVMGFAGPLVPVTQGLIASQSAYKKDHPPKRG